MITAVVPLHVDENIFSNLFYSLSKIPHVAEVIVALGVGDDYEKAHKKYKQLESFFSQMSSHLECKIIESRLGKGVQLNNAIAFARSDYIWCIHSDSMVKLQSNNFLDSIDGNKIYYGSLKFEGRLKNLMRFNELGVAIRCAFWGMPYGDQGILMSKQVFFAVGKYDEDISLGETHEFLWRAKKNNVKIKKGQYQITTSSRKYDEFGWLRVTLFHLKETFKQIRDFR